MKQRQVIEITGVANKLTEDDGINSTEAAKKHVSSVEVILSGIIGNYVELWLDSKLIQKVPDFLLATIESVGGVNIQKTGVRLITLEVDVDLAVGQKLTTGLRCGATLKSLYGCYVYTETE